MKSTILPRANPQNTTDKQSGGFDFLRVLFDLFQGKKPMILWRLMTWHLELTVRLIEGNFFFS
jgi:hypothetical protein